MTGRAPTRSRRRGATFLEVAATLTIVGLFVGLIIYSSQPFATVAGDAQAKSRLQQSLALAEASRSNNTGQLTNVTASALNGQADGLTFVDGATAATTSTVSLATFVSSTAAKVAVATAAGDGSCWYAVVDFNASLIANAPLTVALRPTGGTAACTAEQALTQLPVGAQGRSWDNPVTVA